MCLNMWRVTAAVIVFQLYGSAVADTRSYGRDPNYPNYPPSTSTDCIGAVYFSTNDRLGNWVVINCIQPNGTLVFNNTVSTRGERGSSNVNQFEFVDNMVTGDHYLFVGNSGSDSVTMFTIDPYSPEKLEFVTSVKSQGNFPTSLAYSSALKLLCVLNIGLINNVACFKVSPTDLTLTPLPNTIKSVGMSQSNPPNSNEAVSDIKFISDSSQLIVSVRGRGRPSVASVLAVFQVSSEGTVLSDPVLNTLDPVQPIELTIVKNCNTNGQHMIYTSRFQSGISTPTGLGLFSVPSSGVIDTESLESVPIPQNTYAGWSKFSSRTGNLYTTDDSNSLLTETKIECWIDGRLSGTVLRQHFLDEPLNEFLFVSIPAGEFLYALNSNRGGRGTTIHAFHMNTNPIHIQGYVPDNDIIISQTGQPLEQFSQGIAAFIAQSRGGGIGYYHPFHGTGHPSSDTHDPPGETESHHSSTSSSPSGLLATIKKILNQK